MRAINEQVWLVRFMDYDLGSLAKMRSGCGARGRPSLRSKCVTYVLCYLCAQNGPFVFWWAV